MKQKGHPVIRSQPRDVAKAEALDDHTVRYSFSVAMSRDLPLVVAGLPILSKAWDKYARPAVKPRFDRGIMHSWWYDAAKAARLKNN